VDGLNEQQCKEFIKKMAREQPGVILDLMDIMSPPPEDPQPPHDPPAQQPNWCVCGNCKLMHTEREEICCRQQPENCRSRTPVRINLLSHLFSGDYIHLRLQ